MNESADCSELSYWQNIKDIYIFIVSYSSFRREHLGGEKTDYFFLTLAEELHHAQPQLSVVLRMLRYPSN